MVIGSVSMLAWAMNAAIIKFLPMILVICWLLDRPDPCSLGLGLGLGLGLCLGHYDLSHFPQVGNLAFLHATVFICLPLLYLGMHYPSDLATGALIGVLLVLIA
ncbi:hypothetical protein, partial [Craterilacuibacter sp.]|uniref:hypothetical protein n=1 Tax=Craterilacuibacter sp. TaxID=2870909 RepID=UPI003F39130D